MCATMAATLQPLIYRGRAVRSRWGPVAVASRSSAQRRHALPRLRGSEPAVARRVSFGAVVQVGVETACETQGPDRVGECFFEEGGARSRLIQHESLEASRRLASHCATAPRRSANPSNPTQL
jgi:hypothetical protein